VIKFLNKAKFTPPPLIDECEMFNANKKIFTILCFCICFDFFLSGCASNKITTSSLNPIDTEQVLNLKTSYEYSRTVSPVSISNRILAPGKYWAEYKGQGGTFFRGKDHPIKTIGTNGAKKAIQFFEGGIFVPDDKAVSAKIYCYTGTHTQPIFYDSLSDIEQTFENSADGKSSEFRGQEGFLDVPTATNLIVQPTATPAQAFVGGIAAGIGVAIAKSIIKPDVGRIFFPEPQAEDSSLRDAIEW